MAIDEAMEERAERSGGRLPKPALFALDELANVVRWAALPDQFSHYVVDQTPQLVELPELPRPGVTDDAPPLGPFRTFQVPIRDIAALTGLDLDQLAAVDRMPIAVTRPTAKVTSAWREPYAPEDLDLDFDLGE